MKFQVILGMLCCVMIVASANVSFGSAKEPVPIIFDTDLGNDVDDTLALALAHSLQCRGEIKILAVTSTKDNPYVAPMISILNQFYGRSDIPIGIASNGVTPDDGKYNRAVVEMTRDDGQLCFPKNVDAGTKLPNAVTLIRKILASANDESVVIVQVGFFSNLAKLLDTSGDEYSPLSGKELIQKKVRYASIMAGSFTEQYHRTDAEYNVGNDLPAAKKVIAELPTKIVFSGFEVGMAIPYPTISIHRDYEYVRYHPVKEAYHLYVGLDNNRPTWDLNSVFYAARPDRGYYTLSEPGTVTMTETGVTNFKPDPNGKHYYQIVNEKQSIAIQEALIMLTSEPPRCVRQAP